MIPIRLVFGTRSALREGQRDAETAMTDRLRVRRARSELSDERAAVLELSAKLQPDDASVVLCFCSPAYDLPRLGRALADTFPGPSLVARARGRSAKLGTSTGASPRSA